MDTRELETALFAMAMEGDIAPFLELFHVGELMPAAPSPPENGLLHLRTETPL